MILVASTIVQTQGRSELSLLRNELSALICFAFVRVKLCIVLPISTTVHYENEHACCCPRDCFLPAGRDAYSVSTSPSG